MRNVTGDEVAKLIQESAGKNTIAEVLDKILPGFKDFMDSPEFKQITAGQTEATAVLYLYGVARGLAPEAQLKLKDIFLVVAAAGYYMREIEGERVPVGATVH